MVHASTAHESGTVAENEVLMSLESDTQSTHMRTYGTQEVGRGSLWTRACVGRGGGSQGF